MTGGPERPFRGAESPPFENSPRPVDPNTPVDYPTYPGLPPPVYGPGYPPAPGYPPPGYPGAPPGYPPYPGAYPYGTDPYDPYRATKPPGTNGKAIAALVTSLAGVLCCGLPSIVGLVLGVIAMRETRRTGQDGYGLALGGVVVGALVAVFGMLYLMLIFGLSVSGWSAV